MRDAKKDGNELEEKKIDGKEKIQHKVNDGKSPAANKKSKFRNHEKRKESREVQPSTTATSLQPDICKKAESSGLDVVAPLSSPRYSPPSVTCASRPVSKASSVSQLESRKDIWQSDFADSHLQNMEAQGMSNNRLKATLGAGSGCPFAALQTAMGAISSSATCPVSGSSASKEANPAAENPKQETAATGANLKAIQRQSLKSLNRGSGTFGTLKEGSVSIMNTSCHNQCFPYFKLKNSFQSCGIYMQTTASLYP